MVSEVTASCPPVCSCSSVRPLRSPFLRSLIAATNASVFSSFLGSFLLFDRPAGFLPPRPWISDAGARRGCQGRPSLRHRGMLRRFQAAPCTASSTRKQAAPKTEPPVGLVRGSAASTRPRRLYTRKSPSNRYRLQPGEQLQPRRGCRAVNAIRQCRTAPHSAPPACWRLIGPPRVSAPQGKARSQDRASPCFLIAPRSPQAPPHHSRPRAHVRDSAKSQSRRCPQAQSRATRPSPPP